MTAFYSDFRVSCKQFISETCHLSGTKNNIVVKLGPDLILKYPNIGVDTLIYDDTYWFLFFTVFGVLWKSVSDRMLDRFPSFTFIKIISLSSWKDKQIILAAFGISSRSYVDISEFMVNWVWTCIFLEKLCAVQTKFEVSSIISTDFRLKRTAAHICPKWIPNYSSTTGLRATKFL